MFLSITDSIVNPSFYTTMKLFSQRYQGNWKQKHHLFMYIVFWSDIDIQMPLTLDFLGMQCRSRIFGRYQQQPWECFTNLIFNVSLCITNFYGGLSYSTILFTNLLFSFYTALLTNERLLKPPKNRFWYQVSSMSYHLRNMKFLMQNYHVTQLEFDNTLNTSFSSSISSVVLLCLGYYNV